MKTTWVLQQGVGAICSAVQSATQEGSEGSLPHWVIMEVVFDLCLEREASLKGDKEGQVIQEKD